MLITSKRHTMHDVALWADLHSADLLARLPSAEPAMQAIRDFLQAGPCYASVSWGKDSLIICHLVALSGLPIPVVNLRIEPTRSPYCDDVRDAFLEKFPLDYHEFPVTYHGCGEWFTEAWNAESYKQWNAAWQSVNQRFGDRHISGVRSDESGVRKLRMRSHGPNTKHTSAPIGWWTNPQVFAWLAQHDLPVHPNYAMLGGGRWPRDKLRVAELGDTMGTERGRREWEMEYYGDVLRRIAAGHTEQA
jgi:phosphoadenosine phosphosulfate reductase